MASKSARKALAILNLAYEIPNTVVNSYIDTVPKTILNYRDEIQKRCDACIDLYLIDKLSRREIKRMQKKLNRMNEVTMSDEITITTLTSIVLALLDDLLQSVPKRRRKKQYAVEHLIQKYRRLHRHFDRKLDKWNDYDRAMKAVSLFYQEEEK